MGTVYDLVARVSLETSGFSSGAGIVMRVFTAIERQAGHTSGQVDKLGASLKMFVAGAAITGVGVGLVGFMDTAVKRAMTLQTIMMGVGQTLTNAQGFRLSPTQQTAGAEALRQQAIGLGLTHQMSETDVMRIVQSAMSAGMTTQPVLKSILPGLADFSEVLKLRRGYDPAQSATIATEFAHLFGAWTAGTFNPMTNLLGRALAVSPSSPSQFLTLASQFTGAIRPLYGTGPVAKQRLIGDAITTAALESELGQQTRGGTQLARMITQTIGKVGVTAFHATQATGALQQIQRVSGISFFDKSGSFKGVANLIDALAITVRQLHNPQAAGRLFQNAFGTVGARQAGLLGDPTTLARLGVLGTMLGPNGLPSLRSYQGASNASPQGRFNQAQANLNTAMTQFGIEWMPLAARAANALAAFTANITRFTQQHPQITKFIAGLVAVTAAVALVVGPLLMLVGLIGAVSVGLEVLGAGVAAIATIGLAPFLVAILAVVAGLTAITFVVMNFGKIMHEVGAGIHNLLVMLGLIHAPVVPTQPKGGLPPGGAAQGLTYRHGHYEVATGNVWRYQDTATMKWHDDGRYTPGKGGGGAVQTGPITINVHGVTDPHAVTQHVARHLGDELQHHLTSGAPSAFGLSPVLHTPAPR